MTKAAATGLSLNLSFWVLQSFLGTTFPALEDIHSLSCNLTVRTHSIPWSFGQCSVDGVSFLSYDDGNKDMPVGDLGSMVNTTRAWKDLIQSLIHICEELKKQLLNMEPVADKSRDPHILQVITVSQYKGEQFIDAFWNFTIDGQYSFNFYLNNKTLRMSYNKDRGIMKRWKANTQLGQDLMMFSKGDSRHYLKEILTHWKDMPRSPSTVPDIIQLASASQPPFTIQFTFKNVFIYVIPAFAIILPLAVGIFVKKCCEGEARRGY